MDTLRILSAVAQGHESAPQTPLPRKWTADCESSGQVDAGLLNAVAPSSSSEEFGDHKLHLENSDQTERSHDQPDFSYLNVLGGIARVDTDTATFSIGTPNAVFVESARYDSCESDRTASQQDSMLNPRKISRDRVAEANDHKSLSMISTVAEQNPDPVQFVINAASSEPIVRQTEHKYEDNILSLYVSKPSKEFTLEGTVPVLNMLNALSGNVSVLGPQQTVPSVAPKISTNQLIVHECSGEHRVQLIFILALAVFFVAQSDLNLASPFGTFSLSHVQRTIFPSSSLTREPLPQIFPNNNSSVDSSLASSQDIEDSSCSFEKRDVIAHNCETLQEDQITTDTLDGLDNLNETIYQITSTASFTTVDTNDRVLIDNVHTCISSKEAEITLRVPSLDDKVVLTPLVLNGMTATKDSSLAFVAPDSSVEDQAQMESSPNCDCPVKVVELLGTAGGTVAAPFGSTGSENRGTGATDVSKIQNDPSVQVDIVNQIHSHETTIASTDTAAVPLPTERFRFYDSQDDTTQGHQPSPDSASFNNAKFANSEPSVLDTRAPTLNPHPGKGISVPYTTQILEHFVSRINRLENIVKERPELVTSYQSMLSGSSSPMEDLSWYSWRAFVSRHILPASDKDCYWSFSNRQCEPLEKCSWQYKFGDFSPSRACRARITNTLAEVASLTRSQAPASMRQLSTKMKEVVRISKSATLKAASNWLPSFQDAIKAL